MTKVRSRFFVGPGGVLYLGASILSIFAAIHTQANLLFWSFGLLVGVLLTSLTFSWMMLRSISVRRVLPPNAVAGEATAIRYQVTNRHRFLPAFSVVITEQWSARRGWLGRSTPSPNDPLSGDLPRLRGRPQGWVMHLAPGQTAQAEAVCWPTRRGLLRFERIEIQSSFPFGMIGRSIAMPQEGELTVYPHLFRINRQTLRALTAAETSTAKRQPKVGLSEEFFGLREYRAGDRLRSIDWKRTAHTGRLVARETARPGTTRVMVLLDLSRLGPEAAAPLKPPPSPREGVDFFGRSRELPPEPAPDPRHPWVDAERAISLAASYIVGAHFQGFPVGLAVMGVECPVFRLHHNLPHRAMILDALSNLDLTKRKARPDWMPHPSLVIRPAAGDSDSAGAPPGAVCISAGELEAHVGEIQGGATAMLIAANDSLRRGDRTEARSWK